MAGGLAEVEYVVFLGNPKIPGLASAPGESGIKTDCQDTRHYRSLFHSIHCYSVAVDSDCQGHTHSDNWVTAKQNIAVAVIVTFRTCSLLLHK